MVSVTSEAVANVSFQSAPARSARPDPTSRPQTTALRRWSTAMRARRTQQRHIAPQDISAPRQRRVRDEPTRSAPTAGRATTPPHRTSRIRQSRAQRSDDRDAAANAHATTPADADTKADTTRAQRNPSAVAKSKPMRQRRQADVETASADDDAAAADRPRRRRSHGRGDGQRRRGRHSRCCRVAATTPPLHAAADKATAPLAIAAAAIAARHRRQRLDAGCTAGIDRSPTQRSCGRPSAKTDATPTTATHAAAIGRRRQPRRPPTAGATATTGDCARRSRRPRQPSHRKPHRAEERRSSRRTGAAHRQQDGTAGTPDATAASMPAPPPRVTPQAAAAGKPKAESGIVDAAKADASGDPHRNGRANAAGHGHAAPPHASQTLGSIHPTTACRPPAPSSRSSRQPPPPAPPRHS